jgi:hypothetical protein
MNKVLLLLVTVVATLSASVASASASTAFVRSGAFAEVVADPSNPRPPSQGRIAVDHASGNVYVADVVNDRVDVYRPNATGADALTTFGTGVLTNPYGIAIDQDSGAVYVSDADDVVKFDSDGAATPTFTLDAGFTSPGVTGPLAFDQGDDALLVADRSADVVRRFSPSGVAGTTFDGTGSSGTFAGLQDLAVDSTGDVVVIDAAGDPGAGATSRIERFDATGTWEATLGPVAGAATVGIVPANDDVIIGGNQDAADRDELPTLSRFAADGTALRAVEVDGSTLWSTTTGIAVADGAAGRLFVATDVSAGTGCCVGIYGITSVQAYDALELPTVTTAPADVTGASATLHGSVNPGGLATTYRFEYSADGGATWSAVAGPDGRADTDDTAGAGTADVPVQATLSGLDALTEYQVRLIATSAAGTVDGGTVTVTTLPTPPRVTTRPAVVTGSTARFKGSVDPQGSPTTYWFELGADTSYGTAVPASQDADAGTGNDAVVVAQAAYSLPPGATYHVRLVARNAEGTTAGEDRLFVTRAEHPTSATVADDCPNAAIRAEQGTQGLPDCRAYEQISPVDKGGNDLARFYPVRITDDGGSVSFWSTGAFPGAESAPTASQYVATRGAAQWTTRALAPPQINVGTPGPVLGSPALDLSTDMAKSVVWSRKALTAGAFAGGSNAYFQDNRTGQRTLAFAFDDDGALDTDIGAGSDNASFAGLTNDLSHVIFATYRGLTPGVDSTSVNSRTRLYELYDGQLRLVNRAEDGSVIEELTNRFGPPAANPISADGRRIFWSDGAAVYLREDGVRTEKISESQIPGANPGADVEMLGATPDGKTVIFSSYNRLTNDAAPADPTWEAAPSRVYRWHEGTLTELSVGAPLVHNPVLQPLTPGLVAMTADGNTVYYNDSVIQDGKPRRRLAVWRAGHGSHVIKVFAQLPLTDDGGPADASMSADGRKLAFQSLTELTGQSHDNPNCKSYTSSAGSQPGPCTQAYLYDLDADALSCASCGAPGTAPAGHVGLGGLGELDAYDAPSARSGSERRFGPRAITDDGTVFFDTATRLTDDDNDGKRDVYAFRDGTLRLLSPRTGNDAYFGYVTPDGQTVVMATADRLVGQDNDGSVDAYAIRVDGGLASQSVAPAPRPCAGDRCQGPQAPEPTGAGVATDRGSGDAPAPVARPVRRGKLTVATPKASRSSRVVVVAKVPASGRLRVSGAGLRTATLTRRSAQTVRITVALTARAAARLRRSGRLSVPARVGFTPATGAASSTTVRLTFTRKATSRGRASARPSRAGSRG